MKLHNLLATAGSYPRMVWLLGIGAFLNITALSFLWPINAIYIHQELGRPMSVAGTVLFLHSLGATFGQLAGGALFDRIGGRRVILIGLLGGAAFVALPGLVENWPLYVTVMILFGFFCSLVFPSMSALAAKAWPEGGRRAFNFIYVCNNIGVAVGTAVGGLVAEASFQLAFLTASGLLLVFSLFAFLYIHDTPARATSISTAQSAASDEQAAASAQLDARAPWLPIIAVFIGCLVLWIVYVQWQSNLSVYMLEWGMSLPSYSFLWTLNGLLIFLGQPLLVPLVRRLGSLARQMQAGTVLFLLSFALLLVGQSYPYFLVAMIILTVGEMLLWPAMPTAVAQLSPPSRLGFFQGFIGAATTFGRMLGPILGGLLFDYTTFDTHMVVMLSLLLLPILTFWIYRKHAS